MPSEQYIKDMIDLSKQLKQQIGLSNKWDEFNFFRCFHNGEFVILSTNLDYIAHYVNHKFYNDSVCHRFADKLNAGIILHSWFKDDLAHKYSQQDFGFKDGLTVVVKSKECTDFYHLCSHKQMIVLTSKLFDEVNSFIDDFHLKCKNIINTAENHKSYIQLHTINDYHRKNLDKTQRFMKFIKNGKLYINQKDYLTKKEVAISIMLAGNTEPTAIANKMFITKDTVDSHLKNLKIKFNVKTYIGIVNHIYEYHIQHLSSCIDYVNTLEKQKTDRNIGIFIDKKLHNGSVTTDARI